MVRTLTRILVIVLSSQCLYSYISILILHGWPKYLKESTWYCLVHHHLEAGTKTCNQHLPYLFFYHVHQKCDILSLRFWNWTWCQPSCRPQIRLLGDGWLLSHCHFSAIATESVPAMVTMSGTKFTVSTGGWWAKWLVWIVCGVHSLKDCMRN